MSSEGRKELSVIQYFEDLDISISLNTIEVQKLMCTDATDIKQQKLRKRKAKKGDQVPQKRVV